MNADNDSSSTTTPSIMDKFPSLQVATAPMIGLYFCASWCPDCTAVTPALQKVMETIHSNKGEDHQQQPPFNLELFYVSSDTSAESMASYKPRIFQEIPFNALDERVALKQYFGTCAMKEMNQLHIQRTDRKHGIPTLILIETRTGKIVTENGLQNILSTPAETMIEQWKTLLSK